MTGWNIDIPSSLYFSHDSKGLEALIREAEEQTHIAIDTETTGLNVWKDIPLYWSLAWGEKRMTLNASALPAFHTVFADPTKNWIFANAKYDCHILANVGVTFAGSLNDVQVMHSLLYEERSHRLKDICEHVLGWRWSDFQDTFGKIGKLRSAEDVIRKAEKENFNLLVEYAANDAWGTLGVYYALKKQLEEAATDSLFCDKPPYIKTLWDLFEKVEVPYTKVLWTCERNGILVDTDYLANIAPTAEQEIADLEREFTRITGRVFNPNSTPDVAKLLFDTLKLSPVKHTKGGKSGVRKPSVDQSALEIYANQGVKEAEMLLKHRELSKLYGTYIKGMSRFIDPHGRIHTRFNQDVTRTGRLSSSNPNCFSGDTEVLTRRGWVRFDKLKKGESVAQWDNGVIEFIRPTDHIEVKAETLLHIELTQVDLQVTRDHRCLLRNRKTRELKVFSAESYPEDYQQLHAGEYSGHGRRLTTEQIQWLVAVQADAHINRYGIDVGLKKRRKVKRLVQLLDAMEADYDLKLDSRGRHRFRVKGSAKDLAFEYLGESKLFGGWILDLSREQLDVFCEEVWFWDGCWTRKSHYASSIKQNADWVQAALVLSGKRARLRLYRNAHGSESWQVDVSNRDYSLTTNRSITQRKSVGGVRLAFSWARMIAASASGRLAGSHLR